MKTIKLNNGVEMPVLGYGVFLVNSEECERCALDAIEVGYRLIDTAQAYYNEDGVGRAIEKCGVPRNELFITTKVWISNAGEEKAFRSIGGECGSETFCVTVRNARLFPTEEDARIN